MSMLNQNEHGFVKRNNFTQLFAQDVAVFAVRSTWDGCSLVSVIKVGKKIERCTFTLM